MKLLKSNSQNEVVKYPYSFSELRGDYPNVSFPQPLSQEALTPFNCFIVTETKPRADYDHTLFDSVSDVSLVDSVWTVVWSLVAVTEEETTRRVEEDLKRLNYAGFWKDYVRSTSYGALKAAASTDLAANVLATELISIFSDAKVGNLDIEVMTIGISDTLTSLQSIDPALVVETETLLAAYGLDVFIS